MQRNAFLYKGEKLSVWPVCNIRLINLSISNQTDEANLTVYDIQPYFSRLTLFRFKMSELYKLVLLNYTISLDNPQLKKIAS